MTTLNKYRIKQLKNFAFKRKWRLAVLKDIKGFIKEDYGAKCKADNPCLICKMYKALEVLEKGL